MNLLSKTTNIERKYGTWFLEWHDPQWTRVMEEEILQCADRLAQTGQKVLIVPLNSDSMINRELDQLGQLANEWRMHPSRFHERVPMHLHMPRTYSFHAISTGNQPKGRLSNKVRMLLIEAISATRLFDWVWVIHGKGNDGWGTNDSDVYSGIHLQSVSLVANVVQ